MKEYNIIGDVAGQYDTLRALLDKMPKTATPLSVGDMVDRGPKSKEVLYFFMNNGEALLGNHDHMMLSEMEQNGYYHKGVWTWNGGDNTIESLIPESREARDNGDIESGYYYHPELMEKIREKYPDLQQWLKTLPLYKELEANKDGLKGFVSHAIKRPDWSLETATKLGDSAYCSIGENSIIWNRGNPRRMKDFYQICGHNSHWGLRRFTDQEGEYGICLDTSRHRVLTGMHWPSMQIFQQEYIDMYPSVKDAFRAAGFVNSEKWNDDED